MNKVSIYFMLFIICACESTSGETENKEPWSMDQSVDFNQELHQREELAIEIYLAHHKDLSMTRTNSGVRYQFAKNRYGHGDVAKIGNEVAVEMKIQLLDGTLCYETDSIPYKFLLGLSDEESGLQEVLQLMKAGQKSKIIIPSYLAHGLLGNSKTIPPQSILLIDVALISSKS